MQMHDSAGLVHITSGDGHRYSYLNLLSNILYLDRSIGRIRNFAILRKLIFAKVLLIASLDDDVLGFVIVALCRAFLFRNTVALFIRPQSCFGVGVKEKLKFCIFYCLSKIKSISIFTIIPYAVRNDFKKVSRDWVQDPQMWDVFDAQITKSTLLSDSILNAAKNKKIISFLGRVSQDKGIGALVKLIEHKSNLGDSYLFVVAGTFDYEATKLLKSLSNKNILLIDRRLSESEIESIYNISSLIWCCYDNSYDQASGIFGRAVQYGKIAVVRRGSTIENLANHYDFPILSIDPENIDSAAKSFNNDVDIFKSRDEELFARWRSEFIRKIIEKL